MSYSTELAFLSELIYDNSRVNQAASQGNAHYVGPSGALWQIKAYENDGSGYQGAIFKNTDTGEIVLVNRGTEIGLVGGSGATALESIRDLVADAQMGIAALPGQFGAAEQLLNQAQSLAGSGGSLTINQRTKGVSIN
jgi:hypothetical protein